jgi:hypothetical protein
VFYGCGFAAIATGWLGKRPNWAVTAAILLSLTMLLAKFHLTRTDGSLTLNRPPAAALTLWLFGAGFFAADPLHKLRRDNLLRTKWTISVVWRIRG